MLVELILLEVELEEVEEVEMLEEVEDTLVEEVVVIPKQWHFYGLLARVYKGAIVFSGIA